MTTNQEGRQAALRDSTSTAYGVAADWHALFDDAGISAGTFNERLLAWINAELSASHSNLVSAMQAYAEDAGYDGWEDMATLVLAMNGAETLLDGETQGLAFDFTDQSALIIDTGTPANDYDSSGTVSSGALVGPGGKLVYTSASNKLVMQSSGNITYSAHNLIPQSEDFATTWTSTNILAFGAGSTVNATLAPDGTTTADLITPNTTSGVHRMIQAVTIVSGATYVARVRVKANGYTKVAIAENHTTGFFSSFELVGDGTVLTDSSAVGGITALGDGWYDLSMRSASASTTFRMDVYVLPDSYTSGSISGAWTPDGVSGVYLWGAHMYRYPANTDYIKTTSAAKYALPLEYDTSGSCLGLLVEEARTNLCLYSNDLTQAGSWTASNMTTAKTATGPDNVANSATTITATAGNATILQAITSASAARVTSVYIKRRTGTGNIDLTQDNGSTWTTQAVDSTWARFSLSSVTSANPTVGIRIVTSGDAVDVALFSHEVGAFVTSPILTYGAAATRAADNISIATSAFPYSAATNSIFVESVCSESSLGKVVEVSAPSRADSLVNIRNSSASVALLVLGNAFSSQATIGIGSGTAGTVNKLAARYADNDFHFAFDGTLGTHDTSGTAQQTGHSTVKIGSTTQPGEFFNSIVRKIVILPRLYSDAELQSGTT